MSTTLHAGCRDEQTRVSLELTRGARHDAPICQTVLAQGPAMPQLTDAVMDDGYDSDRIRQHRLRLEVTPVIPPMRNRNAPMADDAEPYT